ncbi:MAG: hypothetical protein AAGA92_01195 [Planctomycetota bacterium]
MSRLQNFTITFEPPLDGYGPVEWDLIGNQYARVEFADGTVWHIRFWTFDYAAQQKTTIDSTGQSGEALQKHLLGPTFLVDRIRSDSIAEAILELVNAQEDVWHNTHPNFEVSLPAST